MKHKSTKDSWQNSSVSGIRVPPRPGSYSSSTKRVKKHRAVKWVLGILSLLLVISAVLYFAVFLPGQQGAVNDTQSSLWVRFFDVGDSDTALVFCEGHYLLIDGGNASNSSRLYSYFTQNNILHLDGIVATHPHADHVGGISGVLSIPGISVDALYSSVKMCDNKRFMDMAEKAEAIGVGITVPTRGDCFSLGGATVTFLSPVAGMYYEEVNNQSLVLRIDYGKTSFLFMGDAMEAVENELLTADVNLRATVLKVAHHGSDTSTTEDFLKKVRPALSVISGNGEEGHPSQEVSSRLQSYGTVLCTADCGTIEVYSDAEHVGFATEKSLAGQ